MQKTRMLEKLSPTYRSRIIYAVWLVLSVSVIGTVGYHLIENWSLLDAFYMTIITLTTIGFGEIHDLSNNGRIFTIVLIIFSMGIAGYSVSTIASFVLEGQLNELIRGKRMDQKIARLKNHVILCGGGRTGKHVVIEFMKTHIPFVVIEKNFDVVQHLLHIGDIPYILEDATEDETLLQARIKQARGLIASLGDDKDNVFIVLSARALNPNLHIIARANEEVNTEKLRKAGANEIVSPNAIGGLRMASMMIRPSVVAFLDEMMSVTGQTLRFEEIPVNHTQGLVNKTLEQLHIGRRTGLLVVAIRSAQGKLQFNPGGKTMIHPGDVLIILGTREKITELHTMLSQTDHETSLAEVLYEQEKKPEQNREIARI